MTDDLNLRTEVQRRADRALAVAADLANGMKAEDVAQKYGMSGPYVSKLIRQCGIGPRQLNRQKHAAVAADYKAGHSIPAIMLDIRRLKQRRKPGKCVSTAADYRDVPCPACGAGESGVKDSRPHGGVRFRHRVCKCGFTFTTAEQIIDRSMYDVIVKGTAWALIRAEDITK